MLNLTENYESENLKILKELTPKLPDFNNIVNNNIGFNRTTEIVEVKMDSGMGIGINLLHQPEISVSKWFSSKDSHFPLHKHDEREFLIIYSGKLKIEYEDGKEYILGVGKSIINEPGVPHSATFLEDTWYISITIPCSSVWNN